MPSAELLKCAESVRRNVFVDGQAIDEILSDAASGKIEDVQAISRLRRLEQVGQEDPFFLSAREANKEWTSLLSAMGEEAEAWQKIAKRQYAQGFLLLPLAAAVTIGVLLYLSLASPDGSIAVTADPLLAACLAAVAVHAFFIFRVHQQARVAAERLSEKRAAILFLRIAITRTDPAEVAQLLQAGTAMFLGHHAVAAVPLQPDDRPTMASVPLRPAGSSDR